MSVTEDQPEKGTAADRGGAGLDSKKNLRSTRGKGTKDVYFAKKHGIEIEDIFQKAENMRRKNMLVADDDQLILELLKKNT